MDAADLPVWLLLSRSARDVARALDAVLNAAGGSTSTWLVLSSLREGGHRSQAELAEAVGVRGPTLTHHLDGLARAGLVTRDRDPDNRRVQRVELTEAGTALFLRLRRVVASFDGRLRAGLTSGEVADLQRLLGQLVENAHPD